MVRDSPRARQAIALAAQGATVNQVAAEFGVSRPALRRCLNLSDAGKAALAALYLNEPGRGAMPPRAAEAQQLAADGVTLHAAAARMGINVPALRQILSTTPAGRVVAATLDGNTLAAARDLAGQGIPLAEAAGRLEVATLSLQRYLIVVDPDGHTLPRLEANMVARAASLIEAGARLEDACRGVGVGWRVLRRCLRGPLADPAAVRTIRAANIPQPRVNPVHGRFPGVSAA